MEGPTQLRKLREKQGLVEPEAPARPATAQETLQAEAHGAAKHPVNPNSHSKDELLSMVPDGVNVPEGATKAQIADLINGAD